MVDSMTIEDNEQTGRGRTMGFRYMRYHVPEFSLPERFFLIMWVGCAVIAIIAVEQKPTPHQLDVIAFCAWIMTGVVGYWMRHEPAYVLQFFLWPFTQQMTRWHGILLWPVRIFGCVGFIIAMFACPAVFLPDGLTKNAGGIAFVLASEVIISVIALWRRKPPKDYPGGMQPQP
jgi:hypothetical protein